MMRHIFLLALAMAFAFSACQHHDTEIQSDIQALASPQAKAPDCQPELRRFDLAFGEVVGAENLLYEVELQTGLYQVEGCMCRVIAYELEVTHPSAPNWTLYMDLNSGAQVSHLKLQGPLGDTLLVNDLDQLMGYFDSSNTAILLAEFIKSGTVTNAEMLRATGLCIIENYDGFNPNNPQFLFTPVFDSIPALPPATGYMHVAYIPTSMTRAF